MVEAVRPASSRLSDPFTTREQEADVHRASKSKSALRQASPLGFPSARRPGYLVCSYQFLSSGGMEQTLYPWSGSRGLLFNWTNHQESETTTHCQAACCLARPPRDPWTATSAAPCPSTLQLHVHENTWEHIKVRSSMPTTGDSNLGAWSTYSSPVLGDSTGRALGTPSYKPYCG